MTGGKSRRSKSTATSLDRARTRGQVAITAHMVSQAEGSVSPPATEADLTAAMQTIETGQTALMDKIDHLQKNVDFIHRNLNSFRGWVEEVEQRISATEDSIRDHAGDFHTLSQDIGDQSGRRRKSQPA